MTSRVVSGELSISVIANIDFAAVSSGGGKADVIFVHGLTGDAVGTWTFEHSIEPEGGFWPKWLATDIKELNFYTLGYPASIFAQWAKREMALYERAKNSLERLAAYDFGNRPIVFVCHSLGGLLAKQMLRTARESTDPAWNRIAQQCACIVFLATPHSGSSLANVLKGFAGRFTSAHVDKLLRDTSELDELNESFRSFCSAQKIDVLSYYETLLTKGVAIVVDKPSADPGCCSVHPIPVQADHLSICKPADRNSLVYVSLARRLQVFHKSLLIPAGDISFLPDDLHSSSDLDRRSLHEKLLAAGREHEYSFANESQNRFARDFARYGLQTAASDLHHQLLADVEQRFQSLIYYPLICSNSDPTTISRAIQVDIIEPLSHKYSASQASAKTIMNAIYFLTERCHIRWDKP